MYQTKFYTLHATLNWIVFVVLPPDAFLCHNSTEVSHGTQTRLINTCYGHISCQEIVEFYKQSVATRRWYFKEFQRQEAPFIESLTRIKLWRIVSMGVFVPLENFSLIWRRYHSGEGLQILPYLVFRKYSVSVVIKGWNLQCVSTQIAISLVGFSIV